MCEFSSPCLVAWLHQSPPSFSYSHAAFLCGAPNHKPPSPHPPPGSSFLTLDISLTAEQTKQRLGWGRTRNVVVQVKSPFCHPTLPCLGNEWLSQKRSRQVTERSLGLPNLIHSLQVSFALRFPRECESFFCWVFLLSTIYSWAVEPTVLTAACFFFFHRYFARTMKSLILFQFRVSLIVLENSFWFCSQDGLPRWGWLTSLMTQKWHLRRQGLGRAVKGLVASGACLTLSLNLVIEMEHHFH